MGAVVAVIAASAITGAATLLAVWLTQSSEERRERQRAEREVTNQEAARIEAVHARLHSERLAAYREFTAAYAVYAEAESRLASTWRLRQYRSKELETVGPSPDARRALTEAFDDANNRVGEAARKALDAGISLSNGLTLVELVASSPVAAAASELLAKADAVSKELLRADAISDPLDVAIARSMSLEVDTAMKALKAAIRDELQLDA